MESLSEVSEKVRNEDGAVEYFASNYGEKLTNTLKVFSNKCWKRAALIIGHALAGHPIVPGPKDLPESLRGDVAGSLGDALNRCDVDDYLLVGNEIPLLIMGLAYTYALTEAFVDRYNEAVAEVRRALGIARGRDRGVIYGAEEFYGLGLASIIAKAVESGKPVDSSDADVVLRLASFAIQRVVSADLIVPILRILESLRGKAPQRYIELLVPASFMENLDLGTVRYIFDELNEILDNYGDVVKEHVPSLVHAIIAYANLLGKHRSYFNREEVGDMVGRVVDLLNELGRFKSSLGVIAWAIALAPALGSEYVRVLMEKALGIDVVRRASEVLKELGRLRGLIQELMGDKEFMDYVESKSVKADEEAVRRLILNTASFLRHALAQYRLDNDELDKAEELFNEAAEENKEIGEHEGYLIDRGWALRVEAIKGSLLVDEFGRLYEEAFNAEYFKPTAEYLSTASTRLGNYLVSLALTGDHETIGKLPEEHWQVLNANEQASALTRLMLNALLRPRGELNSELKGRLSVEHWELINAFGYEMRSEFLPALMVAFGIAKPEDGAAVCMLINDSTKGMDCVYAISVAINNYIAVVQLRGGLIDTFRELLFEKLGLLKVLGVDADVLFNEFRGLVDGLDGKSLVQLIAPGNSMAQFVLMLYALVNGDERLAKAHALRGAVDFGGKLLTRLFLEAYETCCDLKSKLFRRAIARLFFFHV
jgi:tetratricopeptide (TPR) repeat protein